MRIAILIRLTLISVLLFSFSSCGSTRTTAEPRPSIITEPQPELKKAVFQAPSNDYILTSKTEISSASVENIFRNLKIKNIRRLGSKQYQIIFSQNVELIALKKVLKEKHIDAEIQPNLVYEINPPKPLNNSDKLQN